MLALKDIRQYISDFKITVDDNVYIGKMDNKKDKSIGIYNRKSEGKPIISSGGLECTTYDIKPISLLIHWNKNFSESETVAYSLYDKLLNEDKTIIGGKHVDYIRLQSPHPVDIGTDDKGIYEYVIWLDLIYERKGEC